MHRPQDKGHRRKALVHDQVLFFLLYAEHRAKDYCDHSHAVDQGSGMQPKSAQRGISVKERNDRKSQPDDRVYLLERSDHRLDLRVIVQKFLIDHAKQVWRKKQP